METNEINDIKTSFTNYTPSYPALFASPLIYDDDDITIATSNINTVHRSVIANTVKHRPPLINPSHAIADTGASSIFVMDTTDVSNKRVTKNPISVNLPDGSKITSTHECDIFIKGLPTILTGHIIPQLTIASLIGIRVLCNHGCEVVFTKDKCDVYYDRNIILTGYKDTNTDLWTLPINGNTSTAGKPRGVVKNPPPTLPETINFAHSIRTKMNAVQFAHQSLCNPPISTLLKAVRAGFLDGCPNISEALIIKYLPPSTATAKGHMKRPAKGI